MKSLEYLLREFDFSESEAKAYVALLQNGACSGYEISRLSGVSRSKIYNILELLYQKGALSMNRDGNTVLYCAVPTEQLANLIRKKTNQNLDELAKMGDSLQLANADDHIWKIYSENSVMIQVSSMVQEAESQLDLQIWVDDLTPELEDLIVSAEKRLEKVVVILYDQQEKYDTKIQHIYKHGFEQDKIDEMGGRWILAVTDNRKMLYSTFSDGSMTDAFYTCNKNMAFFAKEYIHHDAYTLRLIDRLHDAVEKEFGIDMEGVRSIYSL